MDAEGTRTFLPRYLKVAELRAQGKTPEEIKQFVADAFAKGIFQPPSRSGIDYMLSTENITVVDPEKSLVAPFPPHVMFYGPYLTNAELGSDGKLNNPVFVLEKVRLTPSSSFLLQLRGMPIIFRAKRTPTHGKSRLIRKSAAQECRLISDKLGISTI